MVGNLWEWTADWFGQGADNGTCKDFKEGTDVPCGAVQKSDGYQPEGGEFHGDVYYNVDSAQINGIYTAGNPAFPAAAVRGGAWIYGAQCGVFAMHLSYGPADWDHIRGARCCRR